MLACDKEVMMVYMAHMKNLLMHESNSFLLHESNSFASMEIYGCESPNGDFLCVKLENAKKNSPKLFFADYEKTRSLYWLTRLDLPIY